jgi:putative hemolysin
MYSGLEIGCYRLNEVRLRLEAERRGGWWRRLLELTRRRDRLICILLIGNSVADYVATVAATVLLTGAGFSTGKAETYDILLLAPALFVFGEMIPKSLFQARPDALTVRWTWLLEASRIVFTYMGLVGAVQWATNGILWLFGHRGETAEVLAPRERIRAILMDHAASGLLSPIQYEVAHNVMNIRAVRTRQAMTPIAQAAMIDETADRAIVEEAAAGNEFARLLVHAPGDRRRIVGFINVVEVLLNEELIEGLRRFIHPVVHLDADRFVSASLVTMREARCPLGVVYDGRGRPVGIVTLKDLAEEIVGEAKKA